MAIFGVKVSDWKEAKPFFSETGVRLKGGNMVKNPFTGKIKRIDDLYIMGIEPIYFNFTHYIWLIGAVTFFVFGFKWFHFLVIGLGSLSIFWSRYFFYYMLKKGLRKRGYTGEMRLVGHKEIINTSILKWDN